MLTSTHTLESRSLPDKIVDLLVEAIGDGSLMEGTQLKEAEIAKDLGVSRAPVREAFQKLQADGILVSQPRCSARIISFDRRWAEELYGARMGIEKLAVVRASSVYRTDPDRIQRLDFAIQQMQKFAAAKDRLGLNKVDLDFHQFVYEDAASPLMMSIWRGLRRHVRIACAKEIAVDRPIEPELDDVVDQHVRLRDLLLSGSDDALRGEVEDHIGGAFSLIGRIVDAKS